MKLLRLCSIESPQVEGRGDLVQHTSNHSVTAGEVKLKGTGCRRAGSREQIIPEQRARSVQARLDIFLADPETPGGLGRAQAFDLSQCEDDAMVFWQAVDRRLEQAPELGREGQMFRIWRTCLDAADGVFTGFNDGVKPVGAASSLRSPVVLAFARLCNRNHDLPG